MSGRDVGAGRSRHPGEEGKAAAGLSVVVAIAAALSVAGTGAVPALAFTAARSAPAMTVAGNRASVRHVSSAAVADAPIPAFSRMYETACSTCHTAAPKLNVLGEAFRLNGFRMPPSQLLVREDDPVSLGAPEWDEAWPRAIRSSDLPGTAPLALRMVSDARITRDERTPYGATYEFPQGIHILAGAPLGEDVSVLLDAGWHPDEGFEVSQARVELQDPLPGLPPRSLNLQIGLQHPYLLTFAHRQIDRAARQRFSWETFEAAEVEVLGTSGTDPIRTSNRLALGRSQPAVEVNGLVGARFHYGAGLAQGLSDGGTDVNGRKDLYYKLRYKFGGLDLLGRYTDGEAPAQNVTGQLLDRALILEHFGYFGSEATEGSRQGDHRALGLAARALLGRLDLGAGYVFRTFDRPWPDVPAADLQAAGAFGRVEYLVFPWVIGSLKADRFHVSPDDLPTNATVAPPPTESTRLLPGVILLLRQNVRLVVEGELFLRHPETERADLRRPHNAWLRLDVAF